MGQARHPVSLAAALLTVLALATAGCGSSGGGSAGDGADGSGTRSSTAPAGAAVRSCAGAPAGIGELRADGVGCPAARRVVDAWSGAGRCEPPAGRSRTACSVGAYRCLGTAAERGLAVSCTAPGRSISFLARNR